MAREKFASRIGFILMAAGCAIGLGNVWRFPFITGRYGGALFVLLYLLFLILLGFPIMVAELAIGRAGQRDYPHAVKDLRQGKFRWEIPATVFFVGNVVLLMFYSVVTGWMLAYAWKMISAPLAKGTDYSQMFGQFLGDWKQGIIFAAISLLLTAVVCMKGVRKGVENTLKYMMGGLFLLLILLIAQAFSFPGAANGLRFFLKPDLQAFTAHGIIEPVFEALSQAFFTLSLGIGSIAVCGSYTDKGHSLSKEASIIILLDTLVAIAAGLVIFPTCSAFGIRADAGPGLVFITLPKAFSELSGGRIQGILFFLFMSMAALSTLIAVTENIIDYSMNTWKISRMRASAWVVCALMLLSLPCIFGFNLWQKFQPLGKGSNVLDLEDFIVSNNLLPLGAFCIVLFCTWKYGWGMDRFLTEANTGKGWRFPRFIGLYMKYVIPVLLMIFWGCGIYRKFFL